MSLEADGRSPGMLGRLKQEVDGLASSPHAALRQLRLMLHVLFTLRHPIATRRLRSEYLTRLRFGQTHFQGSTFTLEDRYPLLFTQCRSLLAHVPQPHLLSFGCSTGEEVFTLARYLPEARITGADVNPWCLRTCRRRNRNPNLTFVHTQAAEFSNLRELDAIFCLAVFQRTENRSGSAATYADSFHFQQFEQCIAALDQKLKPGGLLFVDHSDFSFDDTSTAAYYRPLDFVGNERTRNRTLFGPDGTVQATSYTTPRAYAKAAAPAVSP